jgi:leucyl-tRNA synthetase
MMIFVNEFNRYDIKPLNAMKDFVLCLSPFAPHICEELWRILGNTDSVVLQSYPDYDENKIVKQSIEMVIQVTSKIRSKMTVAPGMTQEQVQELALADVNVQKFMENKPVRKVIFVQDKLINIIV